MSDLQVLSAAADPTQALADFAAAGAALREEHYRLGATSSVRLLHLPPAAPRELWLLRRAGRVVGRVGASLSATRKDAGYVGFFEVASREPDGQAIAATLLDAACDWLRARGAERAFGPLDVNTWFSYRFRVPARDPAADEEAEAPFAWEPVNPPDYVRWWREQGFTEHERFHSEGFTPEVPEMAVAFTSGAYENAVSRGFTFRALEPARLNDELPTLYALSMEAFADNSLFEPLPEPLFSALYQATASAVDFGLSTLVADPEGQPAGFVFAFVDRGYAVIKSIAVRPRHRGLHLGTALVHRVLAGGLARGARRTISALVRSGNKSQFLADPHRAVRGWRHEYALFQRPL